MSLSLFFFALLLIIVLAGLVTEIVLAIRHKRKRGSENK